MFLPGAGPFPDDKEIIMNRRGFTRVEALTATLVLLCLAPLLVPCMGAQRQARITGCAGNLSMLWKMQNIGMYRFGSGRKARIPRQTGRDFWLHLSAGPVPLIDPVCWDVYLWRLCTSQI